MMQVHSATASKHRFTAVCAENIADFDPNPSDFRIMIVNGDMRSAESLKSALREIGYYTTLTAYSARRALDTAADFFPSVALLDLELPDMTGFQLAHQLRSHLLGRVRRVPLLAVAEKLAFGNRELARAAGFIGCLTKPVKPMELNHALWKLHS